MATNLRLSPELEAAVRDEAARTGMSQQDVIRTALRQTLIERVRFAKPAAPYAPPRRRLTLPEGMTVMDLLDREDRF